ncbi:MAG TPA: CxxxxCH/CxxCH domain-containing protein [Kofleriaceae bacterium]|nr:CxxxxCH/CxxCH domain-containing protein [Kofleriaceae bacterium]
MTRRLAALAVMAIVAASAGACAEERPRPDGLPTGRIHPPGILEPASDAFHGRELARRGWDLALCAKCHGEDFAGGASKISCLECHAEGPDACATCHRADTETAAHRVHREASVGCAECHAVPARWDAPGHVLHDEPPAEVAFGALAARTLTPADRAGPPSYTDGRCDNVYCHGDVLRAGGGLAPRPRWDDPPAPGGCDRCHGAPPPSHAPGDPIVRCASCHPAAPHLDGELQIGRAPGCSGCHGGPASAAPPTDLLGNEVTTAIGVGAHQAHLGAPSGLRGPIPCATCHLVPGGLLDAGHLDSPPPAEVAAELGWDRGAARCATAWCHGPAQPVWTSGAGAACGTCHGVPPATASHPTDAPITSCATCHPRTIDPAGAILIFPGPMGPTSEHIDGDVDLL